MSTGSSTRTSSTWFRSSSRSWFLTFPMISFLLALLFVFVLFRSFCLRASVDLWQDRRPNPSFKRRASLVYTPTPSHPRKVWPCSLFFPFLPFLITCMRYNSTLKDSILTREQCVMTPEAQYLVKCELSAFDEKKRLCHGILPLLFSKMMFLFGNLLLV